MKLCGFGLRGFGVYVFGVCGGGDGVVVCLGVTVAWGFIWCLCWARSVSNDDLWECELDGI